MKMSDVSLLSGDCILSQGTSWISRGILFLTSWQTLRAFFSHVAAYIGNGYLIEALTKTKITPVGRYDGPKEKLKVCRIPLTDDQRKQFTWGAFDVANRMYGWLKLPLFALDAIITRIARLFGRKGPIFFFTRRFGVFNIPVCSQLYVYILHKYCNYHLYDNRDLKVNWRIVSPDYLDDLLRLPINKAVVIYLQNIKK